MQAHFNSHLKLQEIVTLEPTFQVPNQFIFGQNAQNGS